MRAAFRRVGAHCRGAAVTRLEALDPAWGALSDMAAGLRRAGLLCREFDHFGNWFATLSGGWDAYLARRARARCARRSGARRACCSRDPAGPDRASRRPAEVGPALAAYEAIYARSWKQPEPFPDFNRGRPHAWRRRAVAACS